MVQLFGSQATPNGRAQMVEFRHQIAKGISEILELSYDIPSLFLQAWSVLAAPYCLKENTNHFYILLFSFTPLMDGKSDGWNLGLDYGNFGLLQENFMETKERIKVNAGIQEYTDWKKV